MNRYGAPTTYKKIVPERGCGFILKRIYELTENPDVSRGTRRKNPTKQNVYCGTSWAHRPGFASLLWSALIKDGLIESNGGMREYKYYSFYKHPHVGMRAAGRGEGPCGVGYTVRYHLTPKGRGILFDMMARVNARSKALNSVGSVAEYDAKKDECPVKVSEWRDDDFLEPGETKEEWAARNGLEFGTDKMLDGKKLAENFEKAFVAAADTRDKIETDEEWLARHTHSFEPKMGDKQMEEALNTVKQEALDCAKLVGDLCGEKHKTNERLKKFYKRLVTLETTIRELQDEIIDIGGWTKE